MRLLLDTCVISELRSAKGNAAVSGFLKKCESSSVFISVITLGEIAQGVELLPNGKRKLELSMWLQGLREHYQEQTLSINAEIALKWGKALAQAKAKGFQLPPIDALLAATALHHDLYIVTRNVKDFVESGVQCINPWAD